jgi:hypothetical protein
METSKPTSAKNHGGLASNLDCEEFTQEELVFFRGWQPVTGVTRKDFEESARVGQRISAIPKLCWLNARRVVQKLDDYAEASYVEGIFCIDGIHSIERSRSRPGLHGCGRLVITA